MTSFARIGIENCRRSDKRVGFFDIVKYTRLVQRDAGTTKRPVAICAVMFPHGIFRLSRMVLT